MPCKMGHSMLTIETILNSGEMGEVKLRIHPTEEISFAAKVKAAGAGREWNRRVKRVHPDADAGGTVADADGVVRVHAGGVDS